LRSVRARSGFLNTSPGFGAVPLGKYTLTLLGYFFSFRDVAIAPAIRSPIGKPFSAISIAGCSTCANDIVPQRSSSRYHASTTPGTVPESSESLSGSLPSRFFLYHSIVASFGAVPSALIDTTVFAFAS
jgi:hypothetical protein